MNSPSVMKSHTEVSYCKPSKLITKVWLGNDAVAINHLVYIITSNKSFYIEIDLEMLFNAMVNNKTTLCRIYLGLQNKCPWEANREKIISLFQIGITKKLKLRSILALLSM